MQGSASQLALLRLKSVTAEGPEPATEYDPFPGAAFTSQNKAAYRSKMASKAKRAAQGVAQMNGASWKELRRKSSLAHFSAAGQVVPNSPCWTAACPAVKADPSIVFARCIIVGGSLGTTLKLKQVDPPSPDVFDVPPAEVFNANDLVEAAKVDEIGYLPHTNVACVLSLLKERYSQGLIYTTADPLLVAINPFKDLGNTTDAWIKKYRESTRPESLPPHVFKTARAALDNLYDYRKNQTIIVSGESGAGKTEATKQAMRYFAAASSGGDNTVQQSILAGNPVLEAFGNAKTIRNNNSSRFGRFVMLELSETEGIVHGMVSNFLLEKVRVVSQETDERSYHIFYQLLKGADADMRKKFHLRSMQDYVYLNRRGGGCFDVPSVDDKADFAVIVGALQEIGLDTSSRDSVFSIISGLLLIGNVKVEGKEIQGVPDAAVIPESAKNLLHEACALMYIDSSALEEQLLTKSTKVGTQFIKGVRTKDDASVTLLSLSKNVYDKLFDWIVKQLNKNIQWQGSTPPFIGILDIFGFEVLQVNSLEQVLINVTNEYLQKHFIDVVFESEMKLYEAEGVPTAELTWTDNQALVRSLCGKKESFFALLEDTCLGVKATDEGFCGTVVRRLKGTGFIFEAPKDKMMKFVVRHTIADIEYTCQGMIEKNKDFLRKEVMDIINLSSNPVTSQLFEGVVIEAGKIGKGTLIASRFLKDLESMLDIIRETEPHFIRCLKPNEEKKALHWNGSKVLNQLFSLSILEALQLRQVGYAYRRKFNEFCDHFKWLNLGAVKSDRDRQEVAVEILQGSGLPSSEWVIGKTMVFIKPDAAKKLALMQRERLARFGPLVHVLEPAWKKVMLRRALTPFVSNIVRVQSYARMQLTEGRVVLDPEKQAAAMERRKRIQRNKLREAQRQAARAKDAVEGQQAPCSLRRPSPSVCVASSENLDVEEVRSLDTDYFLHLKMRRPPNESYLRQRAVTHSVSRQPSTTNMEQAVHIWRCLKTLFNAPLSERRLQNICTVIRNDLDKNYGHFWQVLINRTDHFGIAPTHIRDTLHVVEQRGIYRDGRAFRFHIIIYKARRPVKAEIRLHEKASERTYEICRRRDFSGKSRGADVQVCCFWCLLVATSVMLTENRVFRRVKMQNTTNCSYICGTLLCIVVVLSPGLVRVMHSKVPHYLLKDISYLFGILFQRYKYTRDWTAYAVRIQSYLMGRYSEPFGGAWNVVAQEGIFFLSRLWTKHSRFLRVELDFDVAYGAQHDEKSGEESEPRVLTVVCFEACCSQ